MKLRKKVFQRFEGWSVNCVTDTKVVSLNFMPFQAAYFTRGEKNAIETKNADTALCPWIIFTESKGIMLYLHRKYVLSALVNWD